MPLIIYGMVLSPPVRSVFLTSKAIGVSYDFKVIDLFAGEQKKPDFLKLNPVHTIPTIDDNGTIIYDSHAITPYLVGKYAKDDSLYPKDLAIRAIVDQRLHFDSSIIFPKLREQVYSILGNGTITDDMKKRTEEALNDLQSLLGDNDWIAHTPNYTIADISLLCTLENLEALVPHFHKRPKLSAWRERARAKIPNYSEVTKEGIAEFVDLIASKLKTA